MCSNYRPISLTSLLSKTYTNILNKRLTKFVERNNIIPEEQAGFREKYSTVDHIFTLYSMIHKQFSKDRKLYVAFVDYSKFFDTVNKHALFNVLEKKWYKRVYFRLYKEYLWKCLCLYKKLWWIFRVFWMSYRSEARMFA